MALSPKNLSRALNLLIEIHQLHLTLKKCAKKTKKLQLILKLREESIN